MPRLFAAALLAILPGCFVFVIGAPAAGADGGPTQSVTLPDGGTGYLLPDGGVTGSLVEAVCHANPQSGPPGTQVTFDATESSGSPGTEVIAWAWSFGDGTDGGGEITSHVYPDAGSFTATLTATDSSGASGTTSCPTVTIGP